MKVNYRVFNDIHLEGVCQVMTYEELAKNIYESPFPVILNGDIYDFAGCRVKSINKLYLQSTILNDFVRRNAGHVNEGNHSCYAFEADTEFLAYDKILFAHGHRFMWSHEKVENFMRQEKGAGFFKRIFISKVIASLRRFWTVRPNDLFLKTIEELKKKYPDLMYIVVGHSHPPKPVEFVHAGVLVKIMPQGMHDMEFEV